MRERTLEQYVERKLRQQTGDPEMTVPRYILGCEEQGLTDAEAARRMGVPRTTYNLWKRRYLVIKVKKVCRLRAGA